MRPKRLKGAEVTGQRSVATVALTGLAPAIWGTTYLVTTEFLPPDRPLLAATVRALPAGIVLLAISRTLPRGIWWWRAMVLGVLNIGAFFYLLFLAAYHLPGGMAALVMSTQPMFVLLLGAVVLKDRIRPVHIATCVLGVVGVALLVLGPSTALDTIGVLAGVIGAMCMAVGIVLTKRWGRPSDVTLLSFTGWQLVFGGIVLLPITLVSETLPELTWGNTVAFLYLSVIGAVVAYALWFRGISRLPAFVVSLLSLISPLCATVLGYVFLGESLQPLQWMGAAVLIAAIVLAQL
ncbi:EamA family transporter [Mycolicibacterium wolinskyi]|uniref:EamA family transporter n=1 Tax=Mycolicibacterium wolinskyi TaxID=59750 RepID=UPI000A3DFC08|nr:EamA family transporter [Mycolicibacterium wolinskyi]